MKNKDQKSHLSTDSQFEADLMERFKEASSEYDAGTNTHTDYSDLSVHDAIARTDRKFTIHGAKPIEKITPEDHVLTTGDLLDLEDA